MLALCLSVALAFAPLQDPGPEVPKPEEVAAAVETLDEAFDSKEADKVAAALTAFGRMNAAEIVAWDAKGLRHDEKAVKTAALEALRFNPHADALELLHKTLQRDKPLEKDDALRALLVKAICQHGDASSLKVLAKNPLERDQREGAGREVLRARILGLAMIRERESAAQLVKLLQSLSLREREPFLEDFRTALYLLSGVDKGTNVDAWQAWWNDNKKDLVVAKEPPKLPEEKQLAWNRYWGLDLEYQRKEKRRERGDDPE